MEEIRERKQAFKDEMRAANDLAAKRHLKAANNVKNIAAPDGGSGGGGSDGGNGGGSGVGNGFVDGGEGRAAGLSAEAMEAVATAATMAARHRRAVVITAQEYERAASLVDDASQSSERGDGDGAIEGEGEGRVDKGKLTDEAKGDEASYDRALQAAVADGADDTVAGVVSALLVMRGQSSRSSSRPGPALAAAEAALSLTGGPRPTSTSNHKARARSGGGVGVGVGVGGGGGSGGGGDDILMLKALSLLDLGWPEEAIYTLELCLAVNPQVQQ